MTEALPTLDQDTIAAQKQRAFLKVVTSLQEAYREAHERYGLTRKEFAERIGMKPSQFSRILNGGQNITVEMAEAVARAMNRRFLFSTEDLNDVPRAPSNRLIIPDEYWQDDKFQKHGEETKGENKYAIKEDYDE